MGNRKGKRQRKKFKSGRLFIFIILIIALILIFTHKNEENQKTDVEVKVTENNIETNGGETEVLNSDENDKEIQIKKIDLSNLKENEKLGSEGLPVLMYHFFYDKEKGGKAQDGNWIEKSDFEDHLKYLTENDYYFPTWDEVLDYIDGKIALPKKSIVLTVDDGDESFFKVALPVIKKYDVRVTEFLITSWNGWRKDESKATQMSYQSHSDSMHEAGSGGKCVMLTWDYDKVVEDCKKSKEILGDDCIVFCYPCGDYNERAKKILKETGFKLAFTTEAGRVKPGSDKYQLPRVRVTTKTTVNVLKNILN